MLLSHAVQLPGKESCSHTQSRGSLSIEPFCLGSVACSIEGYLARNVLLPEVFCGAASAFVVPAATENKQIFGPSKLPNQATGYRSTARNSLGPWSLPEVCDRRNSFSHSLRGQSYICMRKFLF